MDPVCKLAAKEVDLELRPARCTSARVQRFEGQHKCLDAMLARRTLSAVQRLRDGDSLKVLGTCVQ